jgi:hypothetical protein
MQSHAEIALEERREQVRRLASEVWYQDSVAVSSHAFFDRFKIVPIGGLRTYQGALNVDGVCVRDNLVVPMIDGQRRLQNLAFIDGAGARKYLAADCIDCTYYGVGRRDGTGTIVVAAGLVRGLLVHQQLGHATAIAFLEGNVMNVAMMMGSRHSVAPILIARADGILEPFNGQRCEERAESLPRSNAPLRQLEDSSDARKLLSWLARRRLRECDRKAVMQLGPASLRPKVRAVAALETLIERGWLASDNDVEYRLTPSALSELKFDGPPASEPSATLLADAGAQAARQEIAP